MKNAFFWDVALCRTIQEDVSKERITSIISVEKLRSVL
jgi:hypothetical protein